MRSTLETHAALPRGRFAFDERRTDTSTGTIETLLRDTIDADSVVAIDGEAGDAARAGMSGDVHGRAVLDDEDHRKFLLRGIRERLARDLVAEDDDDVLLLLTLMLASLRFFELRDGGFAFRDGQATCECKLVGVAREGRHQPNGITRAAIPSMCDDANRSASGYRDH